MTDTKVNTLVINTLTEAQLPSDPSKQELWFVTDSLESQAETLPEPLPKYEGKIVQYVGDGSDGFMPGYFYRCQSGAWQQINVQDSEVGGVSSVNGYAGDVVLTAEDISAEIDELPVTVQGELQDLSDKIKDIELVKVPNATIVGSPVINQGQVSGFSSNDYLQFPFELDVQNRFLKVNFCFTTDDDVTTQQNVLDSRYGLALAIRNGKGLMAASHNGTSWAFETVGTMDILPNTTYFARLTWNGILYKTELSTNRVDYVSDMTEESTQPPFKRTMFIGGSPDLFGAGSAHPFGGSINLNYANVEIDDNDIWEGMDDVGLGTRLDVNVSNISDEGKEKIKQIAGGLPDQAGNAGKFLTTDGTTASWDSAIKNNTRLDGAIAILGSANQSFGIAIGSGASAQGISIGRNVSSSSYSVGLGGNAGGARAVAVGGLNCSAQSTYSIAIGAFAMIGSNKDHAIQIGYGTNNEGNTLSIGLSTTNNYKLLNADGTIPAERLSNTIGDINSVLDAISGENI